MNYPLYVLCTCTNNGFKGLKVSRLPCSEPLFFIGVGWHGHVNKSSIYVLETMDFENDRQKKKAHIFRNTPAFLVRWYIYIFFSR